MSEKQITVTSPLLPNLDDFNEMLKEIWASKWVTNMGQFHRQLEKALLPIMANCSGRVILVSNLHPENALGPI